MFNPLTEDLKLRLMFFLLCWLNQTFHNRSNLKSLTIVAERKNVGLVNRCFVKLHSGVIYYFVSGLEPNFSSAKPNRTVGAAPGGKSPDHQPHKGLCDGAHRHRSCVSQRPPAIQKCQWFLGPPLRWPPHFPCCQATGLPVCCRQPWPSRRSGELLSLPVGHFDEMLSS